MTVRGAFHTAAGTLRVPWRLAAFFAVTGATWAALQLASVAILRQTIGDASSPQAISIAFWTSLIALLVGHAVVLRWIEHRPWSWVGLGREAARTRLLAWALLLGALSIGLPTAILLATGWLELEPAAPGSSWRYSLVLGLLFLPAALAEELALRGYVFAVLRETWGWAAALVLTSVVFGVLHVFNPGANAQSIALVVLAGFFLGGVLLVTGSLYAAWMAHFAWNWVMGGIFHTAVSGLELPPPEYRVVDAGPDWATGGTWGPEGGLVAGIGMTTGIVYMLMARQTSRRRRAHGDLGNG